MERPMIYMLLGVFVYLLIIGYRIYRQERDECNRVRIEWLAMELLDDNTDRIYNQRMLIVDAGCIVNITGVWLPGSSNSTTRCHSSIAYISIADDFIYSFTTDNGEL